jgi:hypothetical protein
MRKRHLYQALLLLLISAFLCMQWASAHIHIAEQHDHGDGHHQHLSQTHAHHFSNHHADLIDAAQPIHHGQIVELDHDCHAPKGSGHNDSAAAIPHSMQPLALPGIESVSFTLTTFAPLNPPQRNIAQPRAPPQQS